MSNMKNNSIKILAILVGVLFFTSAFAQKDTIGKGAVDIISAFRPQLKEAAKISFSASPLQTTTAKATLQYQIPNQQLLLSYQAKAIQPLAYQTDSLLHFKSSNYIKLGYGNYRSPYLQLSFSAGDANRAAIQLQAEHQSAESDLPYQKYSKQVLGLRGFAKTTNNQRLDAGISFETDKRYKYGYLPSTLTLPLDSILQQFTSIDANISLQNIAKRTTGINYAPIIKIGSFSDKKNNNELRFQLAVPLEKNISANWSAKLNTILDLGHYAPKIGTSSSNSVLGIYPTLVYEKSNWKLNVGAGAVSSNSEFSLLPAITFQLQPVSSTFYFEVGWVGSVEKVTYKSLALINPFIWAPANFKNRVFTNRYLAVKSNLTDHLYFNVQAGFNSIANQSLFLNDTVATSDGKSFIVLYESKMKEFALLAELLYKKGEDFTWKNSLRISQYTGLTSQKKAWGLIPLEFNSSLRALVIKKGYLTANLNAFSGINYLATGGKDKKQAAAIDLGLCAEYELDQHWKVWANFGNLFNKNYQRWNQYPVYGFNFQGGIVFSFGK